MEIAIDFGMESKEINVIAIAYILPLLTIY
jgi:hypothetical protein